MIGENMLQYRSECGCMPLERERYVAGIEWSSCASIYKQTILFLDLQNEYPLLCTYHVSPITWVTILAVYSLEGWTNIILTDTFKYASRIFWK